MGDMNGLKWKRSDIESALADAGYEPSSRKHYYVLRNMETFQNRTDDLVECVGWALARANNLWEERTRRVSHGTGATERG